MAASLFGKLLNKIRYERQQARSKAEADLWKRNKLDNPKLRDSYRIEEQRGTLPSGNESITLQLWHKVDEQAVIISTEVITEMVKDEIESGY